MYMNDSVINIYLVYEILSATRNLFLYGIDAHRVGSVLLDITMTMLIAPFTLLVVIAIFGTIGNIFIIGAVWLNKKLRTIGHGFVANLALADLITTAYIMPVGLYTSQSDGNPFSDIWCDFNAFLMMCTFGVSTQTLMLIVFERYVHICKTKWYKNIFSVKLAVIYVFVTWIYSTAWTVHGWTRWTDYKYHNATYSCILSGEANFTYNVCLVVFCMLIPLIVLLFSYIKIFQTVHSSDAGLFKHNEQPLSKSQKRMKGEYRFVRILIIIVLIFIVCWIPTAVVLGLTERIHIPRLVYPIVIWLSFSNSSMNAFIYGIMNNNFKEGYRQLLSHLVCCTVCMSTRDGSTSISRNVPSPEMLEITPRKESTKKKQNKGKQENKKDAVKIKDPNHDNKDKSSKHDNHHHSHHSQNHINSSFSYQPELNIEESRPKKHKTKHVHPKKTPSPSNTINTVSTVLSDWSDGEFRRDDSFQRICTQSLPSITQHDVIPEETSPYSESDRSTPKVRAKLSYSDIELNKVFYKESKL